MLLEPLCQRKSIECKISFRGLHLRNKIIVLYTENLIPSERKLKGMIMSTQNFINYF